MQPTLVNSEINIWFALRFSVDYEHLVLATIGDPILLYNVSQRKDVSDGFLAEPKQFVIARHICLVVHYNGTTVCLESHAAAVLELLCDQ